MPQLERWRGLIETLPGADNPLQIAHGSPSGLRPGPKITVMPEPHRVALANLHHNGTADVLVLIENR